MEDKIQRTFVRQEAYIKLRNWILDGTLAPGEKLRDKDLALQLGVSRTPIREALLRLEDEGLVKSTPNRSTMVSSIDFHSAFHLYSIVWTLERLALSQAFGSFTEAHIQTMIEANENFLQKMKAKDRLSALEADYDFHSVFVTLSQNHELEKIISDIKAKLKRLDLYYFDKIKNALISYDEHKKIIEALKQKNLSMALEAVEHNWKNSFNRFEL
ncbi:MAG: GntR family transcriptional regulator [Parachlamydiaceae bacterium]|nr:GntR family transcriptional regulator [Parachlamydiaceae bacterium]